MNTIQNIRYTLRQLRNAPGYTTTAVITLALCIGANAAIFSLVHAVLLQNLPVADPASLVRVGDRSDCCSNGGDPSNGDYSLFAYDLYRHLRDTSPEFEQLAAVQAGFRFSRLTVRSSKLNELAQPAVGELVSGNYFQTFGLVPAAGRLLTPSDDTESAPPVAVLSYSAWKRLYNLDPSLIGTTFTLNTHPVTVVGVAPQRFFGDVMSETVPDFFEPISMEPLTGPNAGSKSLLHWREDNWVYLIGRVKPHTDLAPLQAKMSGNLRQWLATLPYYQKQGGQKRLAADHIVLTPGGAGIGTMQREYKEGLRLLMAISAVVLLIGCANIANLMLVRGMARRAEVSLRIALGATRQKLVLQTLTESVVLGLLGGILSLEVAYGGTHLLLSLAFPGVGNIPLYATPSLVVIGFSFVVSLLTGLLFGLAPALITSRTDPSDALRSANRSTRENSATLQKTLTTLQAALSLVLLVGAGLLSKSLSKLERQDLGLTTADRIVVHISPRNAGYAAEALPPLYDRMQQEVERIPGVRAAGLSAYTPMEGNNMAEAVSIEGRPAPGPGEYSDASWLRATPKYFQIIGQNVVAGRGISDADTVSSPAVAVVNQTFVKRFFPKGQSPIGVHFGADGPKSSHDFEIVGVVKDVKYIDPASDIPPMFFRPFGQVAITDPKIDESSLFAETMVLQTMGNVSGLEANIRKTLASINPDLTVERYQTFDDQISGQFNQERLIARLTTLFGALALLLAAVGLYGVTAYGVQRRTFEIGIRMALGADRGKVVALILRGAITQTGVGLLIGIPLAFFSSRFVASQLYGVDQHDGTVIAASVTILMLAAIAAGFIPAKRAASTDPIVALRTD